jgi:hypothetical protein
MINTPMGHRGLLTRLEKEYAYTYKGKWERAVCVTVLGTPIS